MLILKPLDSRNEVDQENEATAELANMKSESTPEAVHGIKVLSLSLSLLSRWPTGH